MIVVQPFRAMILCLAFLSFACSDSGTDQTLKNCALPKVPTASKDQLLITAVDAEGRYELVLSLDRCSEALSNVYFKPDALHDIEYALNEIPGREYDGVKVGILDASIIHSEIVVNSEMRKITLIENVQGVYPLSDFKSEISEAANQ